MRNMTSRLPLTINRCRCPCTPKVLVDHTYGSIPRFKSTGFEKKRITALMIRLATAVFASGRASVLCVCDERNLSTSCSGEQQHSPWYHRRQNQKLHYQTPHVLARRLSNAPNTLVHTIVIPCSSLRHPRLPPLQVGQLSRDRAGQSERRRAQYRVTHQLKLAPVSRQYHRASLAGNQNPCRPVPGFPDTCYTCTVEGGGRNDHSVCTAYEYTFGAHKLELPLKGTAAARGRE